mgnify:CR=1 FL=1
MESRNVVVTGANGGIGRAIVEKFAENGDNIYALVGHDSEELNDWFQHLMDENSIWIKTYEADYLSEDSVKLVLKEICKEKIDILINNAGVSNAKTLAMTSMNVLKDTMAINFYIPSLIMQTVSRRMMKQNSGIIINNISRCALEYRAGAYAYGSSKAALLWATKAVSKELAVYNIRVNGIAPGLTETKMGVFGRSKESTEKYVATNNIKRPATTKEIAEVAFFLADKSSAYISGQIISVDGGRD